MLMLLPLQDFQDISHLKFKDTLSGLRQFLAAEIPVKIIKNAFYFI